LQLIAATAYSETEIEETEAGWNSWNAKYNADKNLVKSEDPEDQPQVSRQDGILCLHGKRPAINVYYNSLKVGPNKKYKLSAKIKIENRKCYNYMDLTYPVYWKTTHVDATRGIWSGKYFLIVNEGTEPYKGPVDKNIAVENPDGNILQGTISDSIYVPYPDTEWFNEEWFIQTTKDQKDQSDITVSIVLEGFDADMMIDHLNLEEVESCIDDKYLRIPIENEFQGMKIEEVSESPMFVRTNAGRFSFSDDKITFAKDGQEAGTLILPTGFLEGLSINRDTPGIVILENDNLILSLSADSTMLVRLKQDAELTVEGPKPLSHNFEMGIIFATDYEKGIFFSPVYPNHTIETMPFITNGYITDWSYDEGAFKFKNWEKLNDFIEDRWGVKYTFKKGDGFMAELFPPKEFDFHKYATEIISAVTVLNLPENPDGDYSYVVQKLGERYKFAILWSGGWDSTENEKNSDLPCYYTDKNGHVVAPGPLAQ
jgi:hypothetical protein